jgi:hypothetical protein
MSAARAYLNYGDDAEYDAWVEKQADPEWTGYEADPSGAGRP